MDIHGSCLMFFFQPTATLGGTHPVAVLESAYHPTVRKSQKQDARKFKSQRFIFRDINMGFTLW